MPRLASILAELLAAAIVISLFTGLLVFVAAVLQFDASPMPGEDNPQYVQFQSELERYRMISKGRGLRHGDDLDVANLNEGNWRTACLVGGYKDYVRVLNTREAVDWKPKQRTFVDEFQMALVYVDAVDTPSVMHFRSGIGPEGQHFERCITKPNTRIPLNPSP